MKIFSTHNANDYQYELKQNLGRSTDFGIERFTGLILGRFFYVTHHCSYEWEQKHSCQKNTAIGIVCDTAEGCIVKYFTTTGELRPQILIPAYLIAIIISCVFTGNMILATYFIGCLTLGAILSAIIEPLTQAGKDGKKSLLSLIANPQKPYDNL